MATNEENVGLERNLVDDEGNVGSIFSALNQLEAEQQLKDINDTRKEDYEKIQKLQQISFYEAIQDNPPDKGKRAPRFTKTLQLRFLQKLAATGNVTLACAYTPVSRKTIMIHKKAHKWFRDAVDEAMLVYGDQIEAELLRRATKGIKRPVFQKGALVGHERVYSDSLLTLAVKSKKPEYRDKLAVDATMSGGVLVVAPTASTTEEWVKRYGSLQRPSAEGQKDQTQKTQKPKEEERRITRI